MALDVLLKAIAEDGDAEARRVVDAARAEADAVRADADARAERRCAAALALREASLRAELEARRARALNESRVQVLFARARLMDRIFEAAEAELPGLLARSGSGPALERLCREALEYFPRGARVRVRSELAAQLSGRSTAGTQVVADDTVPEGVMVESLDGSSRVDNTLQASLRRRRPALSIVILAALQESP
jgi:vacuolar-type H+-ATPase subunit E/Vma4